MQKLPKKKLEKICSIFIYKKEKIFYNNTNEVQDEDKWCL